jgi:protein disulfide-isomerase A6
VDCTQSKATCDEFGVRGYPTLKWFGADKGAPEAYEGGRDGASLAAFAAQRWGAAQPPPEVRELTDGAVWADHCLGHPGDAAAPPRQLCLVAFLPHILDAGAAGRRGSLDMLARVAALYKARPFSWFWAQGGDQPALEASLGVGGFGYPAFVALNPAKGKLSTLRAAFQEGSVKEFMDAVRTGRERVADVAGALGAVEERAPWDGQDGEQGAEEEFSLEDLGLGGGGEEEGKEEL